MQDGLQHTLTQINQLDPNNVKRFDLKFESNDAICANCRFDVEMNGTNPRFYEYKSYRLESISSMSLNQFKSYLGQINNLDEFLYVFNKTKNTLQDAKNGMKAFIKANKSEVDNIMRAELKQSLTLDNILDLNDIKIAEIVDVFVKVN